MVIDVKGEVNRYVLSGELLAGRITKEVKSDGTSTVNISYYHLDHLNSTKCISNEAGEVVVRYIYRAFGSQLAKIGSGEAKYTYGGKELDGENGLYYFNVRYYDAEVGRFISVDPVKDGLNWYVYCGNNPLCYKDPTGLKDEKITYRMSTSNNTMTLYQFRDWKNSYEDIMNELNNSIDNDKKQMDILSKSYSIGSSFMPSGWISKIVNPVIGGIFGSYKNEKDSKLKDELKFLKNTLSTCVLANGSINYSLQSIESNQIKYSKYMIVFDNDDKYEINKKTFDSLAQNSIEKAYSLWWEERNKNDKME